MSNHSANVINAMAVESLRQLNQHGDAAVLSMKAAVEKRTRRYVCLAMTCVAATAVLPLGACVALLLRAISVLEFFGIFTANIGVACLLVFLFDQLKARLIEPEIFALACFTPMLSAVLATGLTHPSFSHLFASFSSLPDSPGPTANDVPVASPWGLHRQHAGPLGESFDDFMFRNQPPPRSFTTPMPMPMQTQPPHENQHASYASFLANNVCNLPIYKTMHLDANACDPISGNKLCLEPDGIAYVLDASFNDPVSASTLESLYVYDNDFAYDVNPFSNEPLDVIHKVKLVFSQQEQGQTEDE
jgi:hypothetical protein